MSQTKTIVGIYDLCSETFDHIHVVPTAACASRSLQDLSRLHPDNDLIVHSGDYILFNLGFIDMHSGEITPEKFMIASVKTLINERDLVKRDESPTDPGAAVGV